jgi:hypothetical protein
MKAKSTILAAAVAAVLSAGMSDEASASIYARSYLEIDNLALRISDDGGVTPGGASVKNFQFFLTNTAFLNGVGGATQATCFGLPGAPAAGTNNCNPRPNTGLNTPGTILDAAAANGGGSNPVRANNDFSYFGPGANEYSSSDSVIYTAQLTNGAGFSPTHTEQIAESELQTGSSASASAEIQSLTGFIFEFTVAGANQIDIAFTSDSSRFVQINDAVAVTAGAQANMEVEFRLENDSTGDFFLWRPNGNTASGAGGSFGVGTELADDFDLQNDFGVSTLDVSCAGAPVPGACPSLGATQIGANHALNLVGLYDGDWTLTLSAFTSTSLTRAIPEPGTLALVGMTLAGLGLASRRRKQS